jgi:hypothetical protein
VKNQVRRDCGLLPVVVKLQELAAGQGLIHEAIRSRPLAAGGVRRHGAGDSPGDVPEEQLPTDAR